MERQTNPETEYRFKVKLKGARRIWRSTVLSGDQTLNDLHEAIFVAFDRSDEHLFCFYVPKARTRRSDGPAPKEYMGPPLLEEPDRNAAGSQCDAAQARLRHSARRPTGTATLTRGWGRLRPNMEVERPGRGAMQRCGLVLPPERAVARPSLPGRWGTSEIDEIKVLGECAFMRTKLTVVVTPPDSAQPMTRAGYSLSILKKEHGEWVLARDAIMLSPVPSAGD